MKYYKAVVTEKNSPETGSIIANTKSSIKYKGMTKEEFTEATKYISVYTTQIFEF